MALAACGGKARTKRSAMNTRARATMDGPLVKKATCVLACVIGVIGCSAPSEPVEASIRGRFLLRGDVSDPAALAIDKDRECCGRVPLMSEELVVGPDDGLANVVIFVRSKDIPSPKQGNLEPFRISTDGCRYAPHVSLVQTDQTIVIEANACAPINPNLSDTPMGMLIPAKSEGASICLSRAPSLPSRLTCNIHPWMKAWVVIRPNPYACLSAQSGDFEIRSVPPGVWELQFWHEAFGCLEEMTVGGEHKRLPKGRMTVEVRPSGIDLGAIELDYGKLKEKKPEPGVGADSR